MFSPSALVRFVAFKPASLPAQMTVRISRYASRRARGLPGFSKTLTNPDLEETSEWDLDKDAVEAKLETLVNKEMRRWKATKFHTIRRQMSNRGAPERELTWDAIQQIRYLKQESPQEWTVQRLAEGFSVTPDVVYRVLRSKFSPSPERKLKQDSKVLGSVRQLSPGGAKKDQARLPGPDSSVALLSSGNVSTFGTLALSGSETGLVPSGNKITSLKTGASRASVVPALTQNSLQSQNIGEHSPDMSDGKDVEMEEAEDGERVFLTEEERELLHAFLEKPSEVQQKGNEFFDSEGNFLYRI